jgi:hypothetical protein
MLHRLPSSSSTDMETIPIAGAEIYYDKNFLSPEEATALFNVLRTKCAGELRIAFDFDGVIVDDSAQAVFEAGGIEESFKAETAKVGEPLPCGPLHRFFTEIAKLLQRELRRKLADPAYEPRIRVGIVTTRNAPTHERVVTTLRKWGIQVDEVFFLV